MAWADEISNLNTEINKVQHHLDWLNGVSRAYTMEGYTITAAGREGFWPAWRTANPDASSSSTGQELTMFTMWTDWIHDVHLTEASDADRIAGLNTQLTALTADRDALQARLDAGEDTDTNVEVTV